MLKLTLLIVFSLFLTVAALLKTLPDLHNVLENNWQEPSTQLQHETDFHPGSYAPKVQIAYTWPPGHIFDNEEFDCRTPEEWLALGYEQGSIDRKPVPAKALLPTKNSIPPVDPKSLALEYSWQLVGVLQYSQEKKQYLVHKVDCNGWVRDSMGKPILNGGQRKGVLSLEEGQYWVPRIRLLFCAEDPHVFAQRVQFAQNLRQKSEALLLYHLSIDCMPVWSGTPTLNLTSLENIRKYALSTPGLHLERLQDCEERLKTELYLEYSRTMNQIVFDKVVQDNPEFSYITLPQKEPENVPERGREMDIKKRDYFQTVRDLMLIYYC
ncbi:hypothetical protein PO909_020284 [Leuciscus waleckii]